MKPLQPPTQIPCYFLFRLPSFPCPLSQMSTIICLLHIKKLLLLCHNHIVDNPTQKFLHIHLNLKICTLWFLSFLILSLFHKGDFFLYLLSSFFFKIFYLWSNLRSTRENGRYQKKTSTNKKCWERGQNWGTRPGRQAGTQKTSSHVMLRNMHFFPEGQWGDNEVFKLVRNRIIVESSIKISGKRRVKNL